MPYRVRQPESHSGGQAPDLRRCYARRLSTAHGCPAVRRAPGRMREPPTLPWRPPQTTPTLAATHAPRHSRRDGAALLRPISAGVAAPRVPAGTPSRDSGTCGYWSRSWRSRQNRTPPLTCTFFGRPGGVGCDFARWGRGTFGADRLPAALSQILRRRVSTKSRITTEGPGPSPAAAIAGGAARIGTAAHAAARALRTKLATVTPQSAPDCCVMVPGIPPRAFPAAPTSPMKMGRK